MDAQTSNYRVDEVVKHNSNNDRKRKPKVRFDRVAIPLQIRQTSKAKERGQAGCISARTPMVSCIAQSRFFNARQGD